MKNLKQIAIKNKRVFLRLELNVPIRNGKILDDYRITDAMPTIEYILKKQPKQLIIGAHLGRPKGRDKKLSFAPVAKRLAKLLERPVYLHEDVLSPVENNEPIVLLENLRFYEGEKKGDLKFAKQLAKHADVYINDAFGVCHRKDASVYALAKLLPGTIGFLIEKELKNVNLNHKKPIIAIFGAAKIKDKVKLLKKLLDKVDKVILGGAVVFTFLKAMDIEIGKSLVEDEMLLEAKKILKKYSKKLVFPTDFTVASPTKFKNFEKLKISERKKFVDVVSFDQIPKTKAGYDIGPKSIKLFITILKRAKTIIWNGPLGLFEVKPFNRSTNELMKFLSTQKAFTLVCGGDSASAVRGTKYASSISHISTGGGASLELLGGNKLPAIEVLKKK